MFKPAAIFCDHMVITRGKEVRVFGTADEGETISARLDNSRGECLGEGSAVSRDGRFLLCIPPMPVTTGCTLQIFSTEQEYTISDVAIGEVFLAGGQSNMELELQNADEGQEILQNHFDPYLRFFNVPKQPVWNEEAEAAEMNCRWMAVTPGDCRDASAVAYFCGAKLRKELDMPIGIIDCYWGGTSASCWMDEEALLRTKAGQTYLHQYEALYGHKSEAQFDAELEEYNRTLSDYNSRVEALKKENPAITASQLNDQAGLYPWPPPSGCKSPYRPAGLVETMLKRVVPYTLTGAMYYQGEEDASRPSYYEVLLSSLIIRWRELFMDENLPFVNVQLPMFIAKGAADDKTWPIIRQAQHRVWRTLRNTALTVLIDCGEFDNIHPTDKRTPGERVAEQILGLIYGREDAKSSPVAVQKQVNGNVMTVKLSQAVHEKEGQADLFEIAGADGEFKPANVQVAGHELRLSAKDVPAPVKARYAWVNYGNVHLFGENGLPLAPFLME